MAFSGSRNYSESYTAANIIERSLKRLGVMDASESVDPTEESDALVVLNLIVKELTAEGADVWLRNTGFLFLTSPGTKSFYTTGTSGTADFTDLYYLTTLSAAASATDTTITVTDDTNMSNTDVILVEQDDGTLHSTTINGAPSSNSVTLTSGLADDAASGNIVYSWPTANNIDAKTIKLISVSRRLSKTDNADTDAGYMEGTDTPVSIIGEREYRMLADKLQTGSPTSVFLSQETVNPELYIWPTGGNEHLLVIEYNTYFQDLDATSNNLDIPAEGVNALSWRLAAELASEYGIPAQEQARLWSVANSKMNLFLDYMVEDAPVIFAAEYR